MPYENIPGIGATYLDGSLVTPTTSAQPSILVLGPGKSGLSYELFRVGSVGAAENEFGQQTEVLKKVHELVAQGSDNVRIMRIGGKRGKLTITDDDSDTLVITPKIRDDEVLSRYALAMDGTGGSNRVVVYDQEAGQVVYDSDEILVINAGAIEVKDNGLGLFSVGTIGDVTTYVQFDELVIADFTAESVNTIATDPKDDAGTVQGSDGTNPALVERYAALNEGYHQLDYRDLDMVLPVESYVDAQNIVDGDTCNFFKGVPESDTSCDTLGYVWEYIFQGNKYTYFVDSATYFTDEDSATAATVTVNTDLVLTAQKTGVGGNNISISIDSTGAAGPTVTISEPDCESLLITVVGDAGTDDTSGAETAINSALAAYELADGNTADTLVVASGGTVTALTDVAETPLTGGTGGHVLTHEDLTGDTVPADVATRFSEADDAETREVNFVHQAATFCHLASTVWKAITTVGTVDRPPEVDRLSISSWVGSPPTFTNKGTQKVIDESNDEGSGLLGIKFHSGGHNYRNNQVENGDSDDGIKGGGYILTKGTGLPNGSDNPYGVLDSDEALDEDGGEPIDIGKYILGVTVDWPIHNNSYNGGSSYRGPVDAVYAALIAQTNINKEPIGLNGRVTNVTGLPRIHASQQNALSDARLITMRQDDIVGTSFIDARTAAHPTSDYTSPSTIRSVNRMAANIREIGRPYIGEAFTPEKVSSLQGAIDGMIVAERQNGTHQGARASISFSRADRIIGKMKIRLQMVPPFAMRHITIEVSLVGEESEL